jgi:hypothetical protein
VSRAPPERALIYLTGAEFNNAFVQPLALGLPEQMVVPEHVTLEFFNLLGLGAGEVGDISCHEAVHYVQLQQTHGFWAAMNWVTGGLYAPNLSTESWFLEGLAVHYEGRLGRPIGRSHNPIWRGMFESGLAARGGRLSPGDLSPESRDELPFGGNYLVGMHFVDFLANRYGERKLWELIDLQGRSIFSPFAVSLRFKSVFGKSLGALFDEFSSELSEHIPRRSRPTTQRVMVSDLGYFARAASSPADGAIATVAAGRDQVSRLTVRERDGTVRFSKRLAQVLPPRRWISTSPLSVSGISFTGDGRWLFMTWADVAKDLSFTTRLWKVDSRTGEIVQIWDQLVGLGGGVSPDGTHYAYVELNGDVANLAQIHLPSGRREQLTGFDGRQSLGSPAYSPDGSRIAFSRWTGAGFDLFLREGDGQLSQLTTDHALNYSARWIDSDRILFLRERDGRVQAHVIALRTRSIAPATDAPYVVLDASPVGGEQIAFVNRDGWSWTLDIAPLPSEPQSDLAATGPSQTPSGDPAIAERAEYPLKILSDRPYSSTDHLFHPVLHAPFFLFTVDRSNRLNAFASLSLSGSDRLGFHNYAANAIFNSATSKQPTVDVGYGNYFFAPWWIAVGAAREVSDTRVSDVGGLFRGRTDLSGVLSLSRSFWTSPVRLFFLGLERSDDPSFEEPAGRRIRFVGPGASVSYFAAETTPYGGIRRGVTASLRAAFFSLGLGSSQQMGDLRSELGGYLPLPLLRRHSFFVGVRGRALPGSPDDRLLEIGGITSGIALWMGGDQPGTAGADILLPRGLAFQEFLRGYEDYTIHASRAAIFSARYRYSLAIDSGSASLLYLLPSFFVRQLDFEAFAEGARANDPGRLHRAAGVAAFFRFTLGQALPLTIFYQLSARFDDGLGPLHLFGLALL